MKLSTKAVTNFARFAVVALLTNLVLVACINSEEGAMLSDDEKLKRANSGRESYMQGLKGGGAQTGAANTGGSTGQ